MDSALDFAPCGYVSFKDDGTIVEVNRTLAELLEYDKKSLEGTNTESILSLATRIFYNTHLFPLLRLQGHADEIFISLKSKSGKNIPVISNFRRREENNTEQFHATFIVVYQRKKFEDELITARNEAQDMQRNSEELNDLRTNLELQNQELDKKLLKQAIVDQNLAEFSKIISHDMQEPIRKTKIFLDLLVIEKSTESETGKKLVEKIRKTNERIELLAQGLFQFIMTESSINFAPVDLVPEIKFACQLAMKDSDFDAFTFEIDKIPLIQGHRDQLHVVFYHLLLNSIQFRDPSRPLAVTVSSIVVQENAYHATPDRYRYVDHVKIIVSDNGTGFENEYSDYVFEMVRKLDNKGKGIGIGLALSKKIIENHSGTIRIESELGKGSSVIILLPLVQEK